MHTLIYSLRSVNDKSQLSIDLTGLIVDENNQTIQLNLPSGITNIRKYEYLNKMRVYDDGKVFFLICTKHVSRESALKKLLQYAIDKVDQRIGFLNELKGKYQNEMVAA